MESGAARDGNARVCPRCGHVAGEDPYCAECGLHLAELDELPTHAEWAGEGDGPEKPASPPEQGLTGRKESPARRQAGTLQAGGRAYNAPDLPVSPRSLWIGSVVLVFVVLIAVGLTSNGGGGQAIETTEPATMEVFDSEDRCTDWLQANSSERDLFAAQVADSYANDTAGYGVREIRNSIDDVCGAGYSDWTRYELGRILPMALPYLDPDGFGYVEIP